MMFSGNWRLCHPVNIHVFRNGVEGIPPVLVHIPSDKKRSMDEVLKTIGERVKFPIGYPFALYHMNGSRICETFELETYGQYVAATNLDKYFKCVCYGESRPPLVVVGPKSKNVRNIGNTMKDILRLSNKENTKMKYVMAATMHQDGFGPTELPYLTQPSRECGALCQKIKKYSCCREIKDPCDNFPLEDYCPPATPTPDCCCPPEPECCCCPPEPEAEEYCDFDEVEYRVCNEKGDTEEECVKAEPPKYADDCRTTQTECCTRPEMPKSEMHTQTIRDAYRRHDRSTQSEANFCERKAPPPPHRCEAKPQVIHCVKEVPACNRAPLSHACVNTEPCAESQPECVVKVVNRRVDIGADLYRMFNCRLLSDNPPPVSKGKTGSQPGKDTRVTDDFYRKFYDKLNETMTQRFGSSDIEDAITPLRSADPAEDPFSSELSGFEQSFTMPQTESVVIIPDSDPSVSTVANQLISSVLHEATHIVPDRINFTAPGQNLPISTDEEQTDTTFTEEETYYATTENESLEENRRRVIQAGFPTPNSDGVEYGAPPDNLTGESISAILGSVTPTNPVDDPNQETSVPSTITPTTQFNPNNPNTYFMTLHRMNNPFSLSSDRRLQIQEHPCALPFAHFPIYGTPHGDCFPRDGEKLKNDNKLNSGVVGDCFPSATEEMFLYSDEFRTLSSSEDDSDIASQSVIDQIYMSSLADQRLNSQDSNRYADLMFEYLRNAPSTCDAGIESPNQQNQSDTDSYVQFSESMYNVYSTPLISSDSDSQ